MLFTNLSLKAKRILVTRVVCVSWLVAKSISWKLWLAYRLFPVVPPFDFLFVPQAVHLIFYIISLSCIAAVLIFPSKRILLLSVILIELLSCSLDQNRWQSWEYQYIFIMVAILINRRNEINALHSIAFIFISTYFFSGLSKINPGFSGYVQRELVSFGIFKVRDSYFYNLVIYHAGYLAGVIEMLLAAGLLFKRTLKAAAVLLICMHLGILILLGPLGVNYNIIIWPWNIGMIICIYLLFLNGDYFILSIISLKAGFNKVFILFFGLLPFLNFFGYWDYFLSSSLYSFKPPQMYICIHDTVRTHALSTFFIKNKHTFICDNSSTLLNVQSWSMQEMAVPAYPEIRVYKKIKDHLLSRYPNMQATFIIYKYAGGEIKRTELK
ncbi:MAG: hypothetical protein ABIN25_00405 [Ginsengibacter sp.]